MRYINVDVPELARDLCSADYFPNYPDTQGAQYSVKGAPAIIDAYMNMYGYNAGNILDAAVTSEMVHRYLYSRGTPVGPAEEFEASKSYKDKRKHPNKDFKKRQLAGEMVVAPYAAWNITYDYFGGTVKGEIVNERSFVQNARPFALSPELYESLPKEYTHPFDKGQPVPRNNAVYYNWRIKRYDWVETQVHPKILGWKDLYTSMEDMDLPDDSGVVTSALAAAESGTYDLLTELAELPETLRYLIGIVGQVANAYSAAKGREVAIRKLYANKKQTAKSARELADAVASVWMQYRYAISPLAYSIEDIQETILSMKAVYGKFNEKYAIPLELPETTGHYGDFVLQNNSMTWTVRCAIKRKYDPQDVLDSLWSLLKINPFATAWELIPLSFVVDWALNIGDYITALTSHSPHAAQVATLSWKCDGQARYKQQSTGAEVLMTFEGYKRSVITPSDYVRLNFDLSLTWKRQLDALALIWGPVSQKLKRSMK